MFDKINQYKKYAPVLLRIGISLVFLWFGIHQLINPESFLGYVPQWLYDHEPQMMHDHPLQLLHNIPKPSVHIILMSNGVIEAVFGVLLLLGLFTRISSLILGVNLLIVTLGLGYNDIGVRDFGLSIAAFSVFLYGPDDWCLDRKLRKKEN